MLFTYIMAETPTPETTRATYEVLKKAVDVFDDSSFFDTTAFNALESVSINIYVFQILKKFPDKISNVIDNYFNITNELLKFLRNRQLKVFASENFNSIFGNTTSTTTPKLRDLSSTVSFSKTPNRDNDFEKVNENPLVKAFDFNFQNI